MGLRFQKHSRAPKVPTTSLTSDSATYTIASPSPPFLSRPPTPPPPQLDYPAPLQRILLGPEREIHFDLSLTRDNGDVTTYKARNRAGVQDRGGRVALNASRS